MSRTHAIIAVTALVVVCIVALYDYIIPPYSEVIPVGIEKLAIAILTGVAIAAIISGLKSNDKENGNG